MSEQTESLPADQAQPPGGKPWFPSLRSRWWTVLLVVSLMANLVIGGMIAGRYVSRGPHDRIVGAGYVQLVPRRFFQDLPPERRRLLMDVLRASRQDLRALRQANEEISLRLADALGAADYSEEAVAKVIAEYTTGSGSLAARGGAVALDIVRRLTPEERKALAASIRERARRR
jgi:uncharacterized membrane protein